MKKIKFMMVALAVTFLTLGCNLNDNESNGLTAPNMGSPSDIPINGVSRAPQTEAEALKLFDTIRSEINMTKNSTQSTDPAISTDTGQGISVYTKTTTDWSVGDSIDVYGITNQTEYSDSRIITADNNGTKIPAGSYNPESSQVFNSTLNGKFNSATLNAYTINGRNTHKTRGSFVTNSEYGEDGNPTAITTAIHYEYALGFALSAVRGDGVGAKFIYSTVQTISRSYDLTTANNMKGDLQEWYKTEVDVLVYDKDDTLLYTLKVPLSNL